MIISFMSRDDGVSSKDLSNDKIGRDPLRQFPVKFNSSLKINFPTPCPENTLYALSSVHLPIQKSVQFCKCNFIEGPLGAFDNHRYKSCPCFLDSKNITLLQLYRSANSFKWYNLDFVSSLASFLEWGSRVARSFIKCRCLRVSQNIGRKYRWVMPLDESSSTRCLFWASESTLSATFLDLDVPFVSCLYTVAMSVENFCDRHRLFK